MMMFMGMKMRQKPLPVYPACPPAAIPTFPIAPLTGFYLVGEEGVLHSVGNAAANQLIKSNQYRNGWKYKADKV
jgi:hypothetical protein